MNLRLFKEKSFKYLGLLALLIALSSLIILLVKIGIEGSEFLSFDFLTRFPSRFPEKAGIKAAIFGTFWVIWPTALISIPIGIFAALYLEEYGGRGKISKLVEVNISNLAAVPSIVYGLLGLAVFVRFMDLKRSILSGALTLSLLILPVIIVASRHAIRAVPRSIRLAAFALGAQKYQVVFGHVLPMALPGILTGVILSISRAIGETAPLIIVGALTYVSYIPENVFDEFTVLPLQIYNWASRPKEDFHRLAASGIVVLLCAMLFLNFVAIYFRHKSSKATRS